MVTSPRIRIALSAACATALALATPIVEASPANAADTITAADQPYFASTKHEPKATPARE